MGIHIPGLIAIIFFYLLIVVVGLWAARKSKQTGATADSENVMLAGRNIGLLIGIFTMTGEQLGNSHDDKGLCGNIHIDRWTTGSSRALINLPALLLADL